MPGTYVALYLRVRWRWGGGCGQTHTKTLDKQKKKTKTKLKQKKNPILCVNKCLLYSLHAAPLWPLFGQKGIKLNCTYNFNFQFVLLISFLSLQCCIHAHKIVGGNSISIHF